MAKAKRSQRKAVPAENLDVPQLFFLAFVTLVGFILGMVTHPSGDDDPSLAGKLMLVVPGAIADTQGNATYVSANWTEVHSEDLKAGMPVTPPFAEQPSMDRGTTVRAQLGISFSRPVDSDVAVAMTLYLPKAAEVVKCLPPSHAILVTCKAAQPLMNAIFNQDMVPVQVTTTVPAQGPQGPPGNAGFSFFIDIRGVDGVMFDSTRTRVKVQFPQVFVEGVKAPPSVMPIQGPDDKPLLPTPGLVLAMTMLPHPQEVTWSDKPSGTGANVESVVSWHLGDHTTPANNAVPITGVRESLVRGDSDRNFWSGLAFGVAGGAAVAFAQGLIVFAVRRSKADGDG